MKKIITYLFLISMTGLISTSCVSDNDYEIPTLRVPFFKEDFQSAVNNTDLDFTGWTNFAEQGTWLWRERTFSGNGYAEFSSFGSGSTNVVWLVSPAIDLKGFAKPTFKASIAQHHLDVDSPNNSLEVLYSTDYDGTNVLSATWKTINANVPNRSISWYQFVKTTAVLPAYDGNVYIAFKFRGSGTDQTLDGAFQIDDVILYNEN